MIRFRKIRFNDVDMVAGFKRYSTERVLKSLIANLHKMFSVETEYWLL